MSPQAEGTHGRGSDFRLLVRCRSLQLRNLVDQQLRDSPWRTLAVLVLLVVIWMTLYALLDHLLGHMRGWGSGVGIAMFPNLFVLAFVALAVMLAFSNA